MIQLDFEPKRRNYVWNSLLFILGAAWIVATASGQACDAKKNEASGSPSVGTRDSLKNSEIDWKGTTFGRAGPVIVGDDAKAFISQGVKCAPELIRLLDDRESFAAAHVLLTELWRVPESDKERICVPTSSGYFLSFNGLVVRLHWMDDQGQTVKTVKMPDLECQQKRISEWWKERHRLHPSEFSATTAVE